LSTTRRIPPLGQAAGIVGAVLDELKEEKAVDALIERKVGNRLPGVLSKALHDNINSKLGLEFREVKRF
jgi:hypothetical protein